MQKYAFVVVLWANEAGKCGYVKGCRPFVRSLRKNNPNGHDVVLLHADLNAEYLAQVQDLFDKVIKIDHISVHTSWLEGSRGAGRFDKVFTKLCCLSLTRYDKIALIDVDMIVLSPLDKVFNLTPPAGCLDHGSKEVMFVQSAEFHEQYWTFTEKNECRLIANALIERIDLKKPHPLSVNAGFLLLKPNEEEFQSILTQLRNPIPEQFKVYNDDLQCVAAPPLPEQFYLTARYDGMWHYLPHFYNGSVARFRVSIADQYKIIHFNGPHHTVPKPWEATLKTAQELGERYFWCWSQYALNNS